MPDLSLPETIACPICLAPMTTLSTGPCDVDVCRKCGGIWFDKDELGRLSRENPRALARLDNRSVKADEAADTLPKQCPRCNVRLEIFPFPGAHKLNADRCPTCSGIWLDGGEIRKVYQVVSLEAGIPRSAAPPARARGSALSTAGSVAVDVAGDVATDVASWVVADFIGEIIGSILSSIFDS